MKLSYYVLSSFVCSGHNSPHWARVSSFTRLLDHAKLRATVGTTPLYERSARRWDLYLTTHNRQTSMQPVGFETAISVGERPHYVLYTHCIKYLLNCSTETVRRTKARKQFPRGRKRPAAHNLVNIDATLDLFNSRNRWKCFKYRIKARQLLFQCKENKGVPIRTIRGVFMQCKTTIENYRCGLTCPKD
jgi:hypothetical protein